MHRFECSGSVQELWCEDESWLLPLRWIILLPPALSVVRSCNTQKGPFLQAVHAEH